MQYHDAALRVTRVLIEKYGITYNSAVMLEPTIEHMLSCSIPEMTVLLWLDDILEHVDFQTEPLEDDHDRKV